MNTTTTTTMTVAALRANQTIWPNWMADACAGLTDTDLVDVSRHHMGFGTYVAGIEPHH